MSIITKGLIGVEDLSIGSGTFSRTSSTGGTVTVTKINLASLGLGFAGVLPATFVSTTSTPYSASAGQFVLMNASGGNKVVNLPSSVTVGAGSVLIIKKTDNSANTVTVTPAGGQTMDGLSTFVLTDQNQYIGVISDGANWQIYTRN